jgi:hypothetical protein
VQIEDSWRAKSERDRRAQNYEHQQEVEQWRSKHDEATGALLTKLKTQDDHWGRVARLGESKRLRKAEETERLWMEREESDQREGRLRVRVMELEHREHKLLEKRAQEEQGARERGRLQWRSKGVSAKERVVKALKASLRARESGFLLVQEGEQQQEEKQDAVAVKTNAERPETNLDGASNDVSKRSDARGVCASCVILRVAKKKVKERALQAEKKAEQAERKAAEAEETAQLAEQKAQQVEQQAEHKAQTAENILSETVSQLMHQTGLRHQAESRAMVALEQATKAVVDALQAEERAVVAEELAAQQAQKIEAEYEALRVSPPPISRPPALRGRKLPADGQQRQQQQRQQPQQRQQQQQLQQQLSSRLDGELEDQLEFESKLSQKERENYELKAELDRARISAKQAEERAVMASERLGALYPPPPATKQEMDYARVSAEQANERTLLEHDLDRSLVALFPPPAIDADGPP